MVSTLYFESNDPSTLLVEIFIFYTLESILYLSKGTVGNFALSSKNKFVRYQRWGFGIS